MRTRVCEISPTESWLSSPCRNTSFLHICCRRVSTRGRAPSRASPEIPHGIWYGVSKPWYSSFSRRVLWLWPSWNMLRMHRNNLWYWTNPSYTIRVILQVAIFETRSSQVRHLHFPVCYEITSDFLFLSCPKMKMSRNWFKFIIPMLWVGTRRMLVTCRNQGILLYQGGFKMEWGLRQNFGSKIHANYLRKNLN